MASPRTRLPSGGRLYHGPAFPEPELRAALEAHGVELFPADPLVQEPARCSTPAVLCVEGDDASRIAACKELPAHIVCVAGDEAAERELGAAAALSLAHITDPQGRLSALHCALSLAVCRYEQVRSAAELSELNRIGTALMTERNQDALLRRITQQVMRFTGSDAGVLFLLESGSNGPQLRFRLGLSDSLQPTRDLTDIVYPFDSTSLIGHSARMRRPFVVEDAHHLPADAGFTVNTEIETLLGYWLKSMLSVPMLDHRGEVVGVLQLANRKADPSLRLKTRADVEEHVIAYSARDVELGLSLAGQAAVSIENARLYDQIETLFESFVKAAVIAIDQRDPTTAGHSVRVATLATDLARALQNASTGPYHALRFTPTQLKELRYAALLHDFGKVGVREEVLVKARKVPAQLWARVEMRFELIRCTMTLDYERSRSGLKDRPDAERELAALEERFQDDQAQIDRYWSAIQAANEPNVLPDDADAVLCEIADQTFRWPGGRLEPYLTPEELHYLRIRHGSLDEHERHEIETHAEQTYQFLSQIPWTDELKDTPNYAAAHHEKLNGSGYPRRLMAKDISVQTRLITIADVFDALTAADRPYKPAVSAEEAIEIMRADASAGLLDPDIIQVMAESRVYRRVLEEDWRAL